jgi:hypothetical protein
VIVRSDIRDKITHFKVRNRGSELVVHPLSLGRVQLICTQLSRVLRVRGGQPSVIPELSRVRSTPPVDVNRWVLDVDIKPDQRIEGNSRQVEVTAVRVSQAPLPGQRGRTKTTY